MRVLVEVPHPAIVHMFKNTIKLFQTRGHEVKVVLIDKDNAGYLLDKLGIEYTIVGKHERKISNKLLTYATLSNRVRKLAKEWKTDVIIGETSTLTYVSKLLDKLSIQVCQNEGEALYNKIFIPPTDVILTGTSYFEQLPPDKWVKFPGNSSLAYLHPAYFKPDPKIEEKLGVEKGEKYFVVRLVLWEAIHDIGESGIPKAGLELFLSELEKHGRVFISSEYPLPKNLSKFKLPVGPEDMHSVLAKASYYIGDGATMAMEAASMGVQSVYVSTIRRGYLDELASIGLIHLTDNLDKIKSLIIKEVSESNPHQKTKYESFIKKAMDMNKIIVGIAENYPKELSLLTKKDWWNNPELKKAYMFPDHYEGGRRS